jgi:hypothetical protein
VNYGVFVAIEGKAMPKNYPYSFFVYRQITTFAPSELPQSVMSHAYKPVSAECQARKEETKP